MKEIAIHIGEKEYLSDGSKIEAIEKNPFPFKAPGNTAIHEAMHAVTAPNKVKRATIIPGPGYLGMTEFSSFDAPAAVAPHAHGMSGTGYDLMIVAMSGESVSGATSSARSILADKTEHVQKVAGLIEEKKTVSGSEIQKVLSAVDRGPEIVINIKKKDGKEITIEAKAKGEFVIFSSDLLPQENDN